MHLQPREIALRTEEALIQWEWTEPRAHDYFRAMFDKDKATSSGRVAEAEKMKVGAFR
jgi:hypothetical protein